jgi:riboflavin biosynthesis pyrimidine reductase
MINSTEIIDPKHLIIVDEPLCTLNSIIETAGSEDVRKTMVESGGQLFKEFYKS